MSFDFTILSTEPFILFPNGIVGWVVWLLMASLIGLLLYRWKGYNKTWGKNRTILFIFLLVLTPLASLFLGIRFDTLSTQFGLTELNRFALSLPGLPVEPGGQTAMLFSAIPWIMAGGLLGPLPAALLGLLSGLLQAFWDTHNFFSPLVTMLLAVIFSAAISQRYRTPIYRLIRQPILASLLLILVYSASYMAIAPLTAQGSLVVQVDYALANLPTVVLGSGVVLLIAGLFAQIASWLLPALWGNQAPLQASPAERSLKTRFFYSMAPFGVLFLLTTIIGSWYVAGSVARDMLSNQMRTTAQILANQLPFFIENGQQLVTQMAADPKLVQTRSDQLPELLAQQIKSTPFFNQLVVLDKDGLVSAVYPDGDFTGQQTPVEDQLSIQMALAGSPVQYNTLSPHKGSTAAQVSFITPILDEIKAVKGVLVGRVDLASNPVTMPLIDSLDDMSVELNQYEFKAQGMLLDEATRILVHPEKALLMTVYGGITDSPEPFYAETAPDGTRRLVYYQPINGIPWTTVITIPSEAAQFLSLRIAVPLLGISLVLFTLAVIVLDLGLGVITNSLKNLAKEADTLAKGNLTQSLPIEGEDEVGQLRRSFEKMRISLKARLDELNQLLKVSQGVAANLDLEEALTVILESTLSLGASLARVVISPAVMPELDRSSTELVRYSAGPAKNLYSELDDQILGLARQQDRLMLNSLTRPRLLTIASNTPRPASLVAFALRHENLYYGVLWAAYDHPHTFTEEESRYLATISSQAAVAAANSRLFLNAEIGRQRLAAVLASSPDPVLVLDQRNHLILANPAAWQVFGFSIDSEVGQPIEKVITQKGLLTLLQDTKTEERSAEITIREDQVYLATVSSVIAEGQRVGRVCVLRNVTQFKELDALKSDFVSTVSHDLRTPLALMRGYATMLEMVGQLNDQQANYVRKIVGGVEGMSRLVNNLLDLGRIEAGVGLQPETISANDIVTRVVNAFQIQANQKKIQLRTEFSSQTSDLMIEADPALLQQALQNLVDNAIKYTRNEGKITVRVQPQAERVIFEVSDTGIGIAPMDQPRLFEKFYRGPQATSQEHLSSGLGLAIVRSIAERHNGQVWAESQLGKGSTFYIAIPLHQK